MPTGLCVYCNLLCLASASISCVVGVHGSTEIIDADARHNKLQYTQRPVGVSQRGGMSKKQE
jgi:hypothetical protein